MRRLGVWATGWSGEAHCGPLPLPFSSTGNVEDLKSCETSSAVSQLNGLTGFLQEGPPLLFIGARQMGLVKADVMLYPLNLCR